MATKKNTSRTTKTAQKTKAKVATKAKAKAVTKATAPEAPATGKLSQIAAALRVLVEANEPMNCKAMVEAMSAKGYWSSPGGKTPEATLYASLLRHIRDKGADATLVKVGRGLFALASK